MGNENTPHTPNQEATSGDVPYSELIQELTPEQLMEEMGARVRLNLLPKYGDPSRPPTQILSDPE